MKSLGRIALVALLVLLGALLANALRRSPAPRVARQPPLDPKIDARAVAEHLAEAIRLPTISHQDPRDDDRGQFAALRALLERTYPRVHESLSRELVNGDALLYRWQGTDDKAQPLLFMAHQDVVPVEPGSEGKWTHPPFSGQIAAGFVWGRGALDDKGSLIPLFEAIEGLLAEGFRPARTVYLASGFDEEVGGRAGSQRIAQLLRARGVRFRFVLDEGGAVARDVVPFVARPVAGISIAEKGYLTLELIAHAEGGHSSIPPGTTAIGLLARAIARLERQPLPPRITPIMREQLELIAPELPWPQRIAASNVWLTGPLIARAFGAIAQLAPGVRTTTAPTMLQAGVKENVLPSTARAVVNFRLLPGDSIAYVTSYVRRALDEPQIELHTLKRTLVEASPISSTEGPGYALLTATVHAIYPDAIAVPALMTGASDSRHFQPIADAIYRFVPRVMEKSDFKRLHGTDERVSVADLARSVAAYRKLIRDGASEL